MLDIVNMLLAFAVALTYPVQFYAAIEVLEEKVGLSDHPAHSAGQPMSAVPRSRLRWFKMAGFRLLIVLCTFAVAASVPKLGPMIALFGALFGGSIELILPPALYLLSNVGSGKRALLAANWGLLLCGVAAVLAGTICAAQALVAKPYHPPNGTNGSHNISVESFGPYGSLGGATVAGVF